MKTILIFTGLLFLSSTYASEQAASKKKSEDYSLCLKKNQEKLQKYFDCLKKANDPNKASTCPEPDVDRSCTLLSKEEENKLTDALQKSPELTKELMEAMTEMAKDFEKEQQKTKK